LHDKVAVVTGSSTGIGYETSLLLARSGFHTCATTRNLERARSLINVKEKEGLPIRIFQLDVNDDESIQNTFSEIESIFGKIDILVNNAGYGLLGSLEDLTFVELKEQFEANFFGAIKLIQRVLPSMRLQKSGMIVNISSGAGIVGFPCMSAYACTKFALEGLSESIAYELLPFGIRVIIVEPGVIRTDFIKHSITAERAANKNSPYLDIFQKIYKNINFMQQHATPPADVARVILNAINDSKPNLRYLVGNDVAVVAEAKKSLSETDFRRMMIQQIFQEL
jgi:NAD(P)-dependent dehydrogenase (short-subunit alcohol dehydrogenase family)